MKCTEYISVKLGMLEEVRNLCCRFQGLLEEIPPAFGFVEAGSLYTKRVCLSVTRRVTHTRTQMGSKQR